MNAIQSSAISHPERIHPALWRGSQLAMSRHRTLSTGFTHLNQQLPGQGWPLSTLIELMPCQDGIGEINLLRPALASLEPDRSIAFIQCPYIPYFHCWVNWQLNAHRMLWVNPKNVANALWATEQILKHNACAALLFWVPTIRPEALRRLNLLAQQSSTLVFVLRPQTEAQHASPAPLRLSLNPSKQGLEVFIIKRQGPSCSHPISVALYPARSSFHSLPYAPLDQPLPAHPQSRRALSTVAH